MDNGDRGPPPDRCGFELRPESSPDLDDWRKDVQAVSCWRNVWRDKQRCIWHADTAEKPVEELRAERGDGPERLDGVILRDVSVDEAISFTGCTLLGARFENVGLNGTVFRNATLGEDEISGLLYTMEGFPEAVVGGGMHTELDSRQGTRPEVSTKEAESHTHIAGAADNGIEQASLTDADSQVPAFPEAEFGDHYSADTISDGSAFPEAKFGRADLEPRLHEAGPDANELSGSQTATGGFPDAELGEVTYPKWYVGGTAFHNVDLQTADFTGAVIGHSKFLDSNLENAAFSEATLEGTMFTETDLEGATFQDATLFSSSFHEVGLREAEFSSADLKLTEFHDTQLIGTEFARADLEGATFNDSELRSATFSDVDLSETEFQSTLLRSASFRGARLESATFSNTLRGPVEFPDATLESAEFTNGDLSNSMFDEARLFGVTFDGTNLESTEFTDTDIRNAEFRDASLDHTEFHRARFKEVNFHSADLNEADFADLRRGDARFHSANLERAVFTDADLETAEFRDASLENAEFHRANLNRADFRSANLNGADFTDLRQGAALFHDADLRRGVFINADLKTAEFINANLHKADFTNADASDADFTQASLQDALLKQTDCRGATFTRAHLYDSVLSDIYINSMTTFLGQANGDANASRPICIYETNSFEEENLPKGTDPLEAAMWVYRLLEKIHKENALSEKARDFHIRKEIVEHKLHKKRGEQGRRLVKVFMWLFTGHGESVRRLLVSALLIILASGFIFAFTDGISDNAGTTYAVASLTELFTLRGAYELGLNLYFSVITFSTIGYGDLSPAGDVTRIFVGIESIFGAVLLALLVFVLGRRVAR